MKYKCNSCGAKVDIDAWKSSMLINPNARVAGIYKCGKCGSSYLIPIDSFTSRIKEAEISFSLTILFFIGLLLGLFYPEIVSILALSPERSLSPLYWYTFFTYSFIYVDIFHFLFISLSIVISGLIIEKYLSRYIMVIIIIASMIVGSIIYCLFTTINIPYIGGAMISYGYIGALLACWIKYRKYFTLIMKIYTVIILLYLIKTLLEISAFSFAEFGPLVISFVFILLHLNSNKQKHIFEKRNNVSVTTQQNKEKIMEKKNKSRIVWGVIIILFAIGIFIKTNPMADLNENISFFSGEMVAFILMIGVGLFLILGKTKKVNH